MAIQLISTAKQGYDKWNVSVRDTADVIGKDENNLDVCRSYCVTYYPSKGTVDMKKRIEAQIAAEKKRKSVMEQKETDIKATVESIVVSKIEVK